MLIFTNWFIPARFGAETYGPITFMRPKYKEDTGLQKHEAVHVSQFWHNPLFGLWYLFSKKYRAKYEAEAYKEQLKWYTDDRTNMFAQFLVDKYNLGITLEEAKALLK
jgi:hypothetical protein